MKEIKIATGLEEYRLNDKCTVSFNPSDPAFAERLYSGLENLQKKQEQKENDVEKMSPRETFDYVEKLNAEMRETIDGIFNAPVCDNVFGDMSLYAFADGAPLWYNLLAAILDVLDESLKREKMFHSDRLSKYTKKYQK